MNIRDYLFEVQKYYPRIVMKKGIYNGKPCIKGRRIPVERILDDFMAGMSLEHIATSFHVNPSDIQEALEFTKQVLQGTKELPSEAESAFYWNSTALRMLKTLPKADQKQIKERVQELQLYTRNDIVKKLEVSSYGTGTSFLEIGDYDIFIKLLPNRSDIVSIEKHEKKEGLEFESK